MALAPITITSSILASGPELAGPTSPLTAQAIGVGVYQWVINPANFALSGITTGQVGAGTVLGKVNIVPDVSLISLSLMGAGVNGPTAQLLAKAVGIGVASAVSSSAQYTGASVGVALGTDVSVVSINNPSSLIASLSGAFSTFYGGGGPSMSLVASGLGIGISAMLQTAAGTGVVSGVPTYVTPAVGSSPLNNIF